MENTDPQVYRKLGDLENEVEKLKKELRQKEFQNESLESVLIKLKTDSQLHKKEVSKHSREKAALAQSIADLEDKCTAHDKDKIRLQNMFESVNNKYDKQSQQVKEKDRELSRLQSELVRLQDACSTSAAGTKKEHELVALKDSEVARLQAKNADMEKKHQLFKQQIDELNKLLQAADRQRVAEVQKIREATKAREAQLQRDMTELREELKNSSGTNDKRVEELQANLDAAAAEKQSLQAEVEKVKNALQQRSSSLDQVQSGAASKMRELEKENKMLIHEIEVMANDLNAAIEDVTKFQTRAGDDKSKIESLNHTIAALEQAREQDAAALTSLEQQLLEAGEAASTAHTSLATEKKEMAQLRASLANLQSMYEHAQSEKVAKHDSASTAINELEQTLDAVDRQAHTSEAQVKGLQQTILQLENKVASLEKQKNEMEEATVTQRETLMGYIHEWGSKLEQKEAEKDAAVSKIKEQWDTSLEKHERRYADLQSRFTVLADELTEATEKAQTQIASLTADRDAKASRVSELEATVTNLKMTVSAREQEKDEAEADATSSVVSDIEAQLTIAREEVSKRDAEVKNLQTRAANMETILMKAANRVEEIEAAREKQVGDLQVALTNAEEALAAKKSEIESIRTNAENKSAGLHKSLESTRAKYNEMEGDLATTTAQLMASCQELEGVQASLSSASKALAASEDEAARLRSQLEKITERYNSEVKGKDSEIADLVSQLEKHESELGRVKIALAEKEAQLQNADNVVAELAAARDALSSTEEKHEVERSELVSALERAEGVAAERLEKCTSLQTDLDNATAALQKAVETSSSSASELEIRVNELTAALVEKEQQLPVLTAQVSDLRQKLSLAEQRVEQATVDAAELERFRVEHESIHFNHALEIETWEDKYDEVSEKADDLKARLEAALSAASSSEERIKTSTATWESERASLVSSLEQLEDKIATTVLSLKEAQEQKELLEEKLRKELENSNSDWSVQKQDLEDEIAYLKEVIVDKEEDNEELLSQMETMQKQMKETEEARSGSVSDARSTVESLNAKVADLSSQCSTLADQLAEAQDARAAIESDKVALASDVARLEAAQTSIDATMVEKEEALQLSHTKIAELETVVEQHSQRVVDLESQIDNIMTVADFRLSKLKKTEEQLVQAKAQIASEQGKVVDMQLEMEELRNMQSNADTNAREHHTVAIEALRVEREKAVARVAELESMLERVTMEREGLKRTVSTSSAELEEFQNERSILAAKVAELEQQVADTAAYHVQRDESFEGKLRTLEVEKNALARELVETRHAVSLAGEAGEKSQQEVSTLRSSISSMEIQHAKALSEKDSALHTAVNEIVSLKERRDSLEQAISKKDLQIAALQTEMASAGEASAKYSDVQKELTQVKMALADTKEQLANKVQKHVAVQNDLKKRIGDVCLRNEELNASLKQSADELSSVKSELDAKVQDLNSLSRSIADSTVRETTLRDRLAVIESQHAEATAGLRTEIQTLTSDKIALTAALTEVREELTKEASLRESMTMQRDEVTMRRAELEQETSVSGMRLQNEVMEKELEVAKIRAEMATLRKKFNTLTTQEDTLRKEHKDALLQWKADKQDLQFKLSSSRDSIETAARARVEGEVFEMQQQIDELRSALEKKAEAGGVSSASDMTENQANLLEEMSNLSSENNNLRKKLERAEKRNELLRKRMATIKDDGVDKKNTASKKKGTYALTMPDFENLSSSSANSAINRLNM